MYQGTRQDCNNLSFCIHLPNQFFTCLSIVPDCPKHFNPPAHCIRSPNKTSAICPLHPFAKQVFTYLSIVTGYTARFYIYAHCIRLPNNGKHIYPFYPVTKQVFTHLPACIRLPNKFLSTCELFLVPRSLYLSAHCIQLPSTFYTKITNITGYPLSLFRHVHYIWFLDDYHNLSILSDYSKCLHLSVFASRYLS